MPQYLGDNIIIAVQAILVTLVIVPSARMLMSVLQIQITVTPMHPVQTLMVLLRVPVILATVVTAIHVTILTNARPKRMNVP